MWNPVTAPASLRDRAYQTLKRRIVEVDLRPGTRLVERDLAADLEVSRIPLREALRMLAADGLVLLVPSKGALVATFSPADVADLFDVREALESLAARLAAQRATAVGVSALARRLDEARAATAAGDRPRIAAANAAFHAEIIEMAANPLLTTLTAPLAARTEWLFHLTASRDPGEQCSEHEHLFDLIAAGDAEGAAACAFTHVTAGRELSVALAESWSDPEFDPVLLASGRRRTRKG
ncbi:GntR family transcriptional regulator [Nocardia puris]|uniref:GntR family transcriptional regulator n=1 Tax=Nocardia puris TaxID=208602 RepID=A0A366DV38_9NOCA|nr:GntR family transcriptional regulator [Nocardia puris]MBF6369254.1 GntR family transcriptional regulator [Nocardia puris]MBF6457789.1 GntR family transcriptional regulator [Nocardia puris]RBO93956.1 GntR family transcriptional regulator [Nocardia puris]